MKKNSEAILKIEKLAYGGMGVAKVDDEVVFVERAFPGSTVKAIITTKKKNFYIARTLEVLEPSPWEQLPFCMHESYCGGCLWQRLKYSAQLEWKYLQVVEALKHIGKAENIKVFPIEPSPKELYYRNKMEFTFSSRRWLRPDEIERGDALNRDCGLGLHVYSHFDKVFNVEECFLESEEAVKILKLVRNFCLESGLSAYDISRKEPKGFWRFLVVREAKKTGERLINLITTDESHPDKVIEALGSYLAGANCNITTFVHSVGKSKSQVAIGDVSRILWGSGYIKEELLGFRFQISANSFFQTNPLGAEKLYSKIIDCANLSGKEEVWDLYCGTGSISIVVAPMARLVIGVEIIKDAVEDAYKNASLNGVENCVFYHGDIKDVIKTMGGRKPDVVITDPPRAGMHPKVVKALLELSPRKIVAVSCNPTTLARDLAMLSEKYRIKAVYPFDLFPHTPHIECIADLEFVG